jgi:hypothetical protein
MLGDSRRRYVVVWIGALEIAIYHPLQLQGVNWQLAGFAYDGRYQLWIGIIRVAWWPK